MPYFTYVLWGDPSNADVTRKLYAERLPFPFNFVYPSKYIERASDFLNTVSNFLIEDKLTNHKTAEITLNAKKYINMLAERIEKNRWFFDGQKPDEFDATIFAAISILLNLQIPNNNLKSHITECPNLTSYIDRVRKKYLLDLQVEQIESNAPAFSRIQRIFMNKEKGTLTNGVIKVMFGLLTVSTMVLYAISHGILEIVTEDNDSAQYYGDDDD